MGELSVVLIFVVLQMTAFANCRFILNSNIEWAALNRPGILPVKPNGALTQIPGYKQLFDEDQVAWTFFTDQKYAELNTSASIVSSLIYSHFQIHTPITVRHGSYAAVRFLKRKLDLDPLKNFNSAKFRAMIFVAAYLQDTQRLEGEASNVRVGENDFIALNFSETLGAGKNGFHKKGKIVSGPVGGYPAFDSLTNELNKIDWARFDVDHAWNNLSDDDFKFALQGFESLTDDNIRAYVESAGYSDPQDTNYMIEKLIHNRDIFKHDLRR